MFYRCHLCPTVYHAECLPEGIVYEMAEVIECPGPHPNAAFHYRINSASKLAAALAPARNPATLPTPVCATTDDSVLMDMPVLSAKVRVTKGKEAATASEPTSVPDTATPSEAATALPKAIKRARKRKVDADGDEWLSDVDALSEEERRQSSRVLSPIAALASVATNPRLQAPASQTVIRSERQVSGPLFFGYGIPSVQGVIRTLPDADLVLPLVNEKFRTVPAPFGDPNSVPCRVGSNLIIDSFGVVSGYNCHLLFSDRYVIPVGFQSRRKIAGLYDGCWYCCADVLLS
jgi:hypothetical protein